MKSIIHLYKEQLVLFRSHYRRTFFGFLILFLSSAFVTFIYSYENPALTVKLVEQITKIFEGTDLLDPSKSNLELAIGLFLNNTRVCILVVATGFIPIFIPALLILFMNGAIMGIILGFIQGTGGSAVFSFFTGILPHGLFEIPAILLSGALAFFLSKRVLKTWSKGDPFVPHFFNTLKTIGLIMIPLLFLAGFIEAFITPMIFEWMQ